MFDVRAWMEANDVERVERREDEYGVLIVAHGKDDIHVIMPEIPHDKMPARDNELWLLMEFALRKKRGIRLYE